MLFLQADEEVSEGPRVKRRVTKSELFDLDISKYEEVASAVDKYSSRGFKDSYEYPLRSFVFNPRVGVRF